VPQKAAEVEAIRAFLSQFIGAAPSEPPPQVCECGTDNPLAGRRGAPLCGMVCFKKTLHFHCAQTLRGKTRPSLGSSGNKAIALRQEASPSVYSPAIAATAAALPGQILSSCAAPIRGAPIESPLGAPVLPSAAQSGFESAAEIHLAGPSSLVPHDTSSAAATEKAAVDGGFPAPTEQLDELEALAAIFGEEFECFSGGVVGVGGGSLSGEGLGTRDDLATPIRFCIRLRDPGSGSDPTATGNRSPSQSCSLVFTLPRVRIALPGYGSPSPGYGSPSPGTDRRVHGSLTAIPQLASGLPVWPPHTYLLQQAILTSRLMQFPTRSLFPFSIPKGVPLRWRPSYCLHPIPARGFRPPRVGAP